MIYKNLLIIILLAVFAHADYYYESINDCISDFYYQNGDLIYKLSSDSQWYTANIDNGFSLIHEGFSYDTTNNLCTIPQSAINLGLTATQYNFLIALTALLLGFTTLFFMLIIVTLGVRK